MDLNGHAELLERAVRDWVEQELPGETGLAGRAGLVAGDAYARGATVGEACREAHALVRSWCRHPSHRRLEGTRRLEGARRLETTAAPLAS